MGHLPDRMHAVDNVAPLIVVIKHVLASNTSAPRALQADPSTPFGR